MQDTENLTPIMLKKCLAIKYCPSIILINSKPLQYLKYNDILKSPAITFGGLSHIHDIDKSLGTVGRLLLQGHSHLPK